MFNVKKITLLAVWLLFLRSHGSAFAIESTCYGTTENGRLENGVKLPSEGKNFRSYSSLAGLMGRIYVHSTVRDIVVEAYRNLEEEQPEKVYKYAESGFKDGGSFKPHKTHQNGLSVDFIVPVVNKKGEPVYLPTHAFNKYGYDIEFDKTGRYDEYTIDYESLGAHLVELHKAAKKHRIDIRRVIFSPELQPYLLRTMYGEYIKTHIQLSKKPSWVRHDEHYHVDFRIDCKTMNR